MKITVKKWMWNIFLLLLSLNIVWFLMTSPPLSLKWREWSIIYHSLKNTENCSKTRSETGLSNSMECSSFKNYFIRFGKWFIVLSRVISNLFIFTLFLNYDSPSLKKKRNNNTLSMGRRSADVSGVLSPLI